MGRKDYLEQQYLSRPQEFADVINLALFAGECVVGPDNVQDMNPKEIVSITINEREFQDECVREESEIANSGRNEESYRGSNGECSEGSSGGSSEDSNVGGSEGGSGAGNERRTGIRSRAKGKKIIFENRFRDVIKSVKINSASYKVNMIVGEEAQSHVHYAMPVRDMLYDAINYANQVQAISDENRKNNKKKVLMNSCRVWEKMIN